MAFTKEDQRAAVRRYYLRNRAKMIARTRDWQLRDRYGIDTPEMVNVPSASKHRTASDWLLTMTTRPDRFVVFSVDEPLLLRRAAAYLEDK